MASKSKAASVEQEPEPALVPGDRVVVVDGVPRLMVPLDSIFEDLANANVHDDADITSLMAKLATFGQVEPLVIQASTRKIIGGNGRLHAMRRLGWTECWGNVEDVDNVTATAMGIALNTRKSHFDEPTLAKHLRALQSEGFNLVATGFEDAEVDRMLERLGAGLAGTDPVEAPEPQVDRAAELQEKWQVKAGDLWTIPSKATPGKEHRLLCGDCRKPEDIAQLCPEKVNGAFTSPPYAEQRKEQYGGTSADQYVDWWEAVQANVRGVLADDGSFLVNIKAHCEDGERSLYVMDLVTAMRRRWGWRYVDEFCWRNTKNGVPGGWNNRFKNAFEPIYQFSIGPAIVFRPDAVAVESDACFDYHAETGKTSTGSGFTAGKKVGGYKEGMARPSNVVECAASAGSDHSAAFPVDLPSFFLKAFSDPSDTWLDTFCGSGTTIVAAEQTGRLCRGIEIAPKYCAVILERLSGMGLGPALASA